MGSTRSPSVVLICPWVVRLIAKLGGGIRERGREIGCSSNQGASKFEPCSLSDDCPMISVCGKGSLTEDPRPGTEPMSALCQKRTFKKAGLQFFYWA